MVGNFELGQSMILPIRCDSDGNIYVRFYHGKAPRKEPIHKLNIKGEHIASYTATSDSTLSAGNDFAVGTGGDVYQLASSRQGSYLVSYNKDGPIKSKFKLEPDFNAVHFEVFGSGEF